MSGNEFKKWLANHPLGKYYKCSVDEESDVKRYGKGTAILYRKAIAHLVYKAEVDFSCPGTITVLNLMLANTKFTITSVYAPACSEANKKLARKTFRHLARKKKCYFNSHKKTPLNYARRLHGLVEELSRETERGSRNRGTSESTDRRTPHSGGTNTGEVVRNATFPQFSNSYFVSPGMTFPQVSNSFLSISRRHDNLPQRRYFSS